MKYIITHNSWDKYISDEFYSIMSELEENYRWKIVYVEDVDISEIRRISEDNITLFFETYNIFDIHNDIKCDMFFCDDLHFHTTERYYQKLRAFNSCKVLLSTYEYLISDIYELGCKKIWVPHCVSKSILEFKDIRDITERHKDILLIGNLNEQYYPLRNLWKSHSDVISHPGYKSYPGYNIRSTCYDEDLYESRVRHNYANIIAQYKYGITCTSIYHYLVAKFFEMPSLGTVLICDEFGSRKMRELGFNHLIEYNQYNISLINDRVKNMDDIEYKELSYLGRCNILENHTYKNRAYQIDNIIS